MSQKKILRHCSVQIKKTQSHTILTYLLEKATTSKNRVLLGAVKNRQEPALVLQYRHISFVTIVMRNENVPNVNRLKNYCFRAFTFFPFHVKNKVLSSIPYIPFESPRAWFVMSASPRMRF